MRPTDALAHRRITLDWAREILAHPRNYTDRVVEVAHEFVAITTDCETYYVTADMTAVAVAAGRTMPRQELRRDDLPAERGFMLFDRPVGFRKFADAAVPVTAIAWGSRGIAEFGRANPDYACDCAAATLCAICRMDDPEAFAEALDQNGCDCAPCTCPASTPRGEGQEFAIYPMGAYPGSTQLLPLLGGSDESDGGYYDTTTWTCGDTPVNDLTDISATVLATWTLMQQSLSVSERQHADRPERRRAGRAQLPSDVLVVRLRRRSIDHDGPENPDTAGVSWSHRWLVGGHWRNQWLPSRSCHRQQWISGYVKGPASKPLLVKDRVTAWVR